MIVYVVTSGEYSDYRVEGIYSTRELAELAAATITDANEKRAAYLLETQHVLPT